MVMSEFLSSEALRRDIAHVHVGAQFSESERPIGIQIYGASPPALSEAASMVSERYHPDFLDINFGCPVKKVVRTNGGSACLRDLDLVTTIIHDVREASAVPVSVKIRSGWDEATRHPVEIGLRCQDAGAQMLILHARTRSQMYGGSARWDEIAALVETLDIPVVGNGDIVEPADAARMWRDTGCAGMMIGRGCFGRPWLFRQARSMLDGEQPIADPGANARFEIALQHRDLLVDLRGDSRHSACEFRKHLGWYTKGLANSAGLRAKLHQIESLSEVDSIFEEYLKSMEIAA